MENDVLNEEMKNIGMPQQKNALSFKGSESKRNRNLQNLVLNQMITINTSRKREYVLLITAKTDIYKTNEDIPRESHRLLELKDLQYKERSFSDWKGRKSAFILIEFDYYGERTKINLFDDEDSNKNSRSGDVNDIEDNDIKLP